MGGVTDTVNLANIAVTVNKLIDAVDQLSRRIK
jgi:hypothetical protein